MKTVAAIARRELDAYFATPVGWLCLCGFVLETGFFFALMVTEYNAQAIQAAYNPYMEGLNINDYLLPGLFGNMAVILLLLAPALSMRLFAEDRRQHSLELLLSSPVSSLEVVLGKYLGSLGFITVLLAGTLPSVVILYWLGQPDPGILAASYGGLILLAAAFMAVGMVTSSFTENQVVALVISFGLLLALWIVGWTQDLTSGTFGEVLSYLSVNTHSEELYKGLVHLKDIVYYVTFIGFFIFATQQRVESFRWQ